MLHLSQSIGGAKKRISPTFAAALIANGVFTSSEYNAAH